MWWILTASAATWNIPTDFPTVTAAMADASVVSGDVFVLAGGTHEGFTVSDGRTFTVRGTEAAPATLMATLAGAPVLEVLNASNISLETLIVEGSGVRQGLYLNSGGVSAVNVTFQNGSASRGGCVEVDAGGLLYAELSTFSACQANSSGGAVHVNGSAIAIVDSQFLNNSSDNAGGAISGENASSLQVSGSYLYGNASTGGTGGALDVAGSSSTLQLSDSTVELSYASQHGGALHVQGALVEITDTLFLQNLADNEGGAIMARSDATIDLQRSALANNQAQKGGGLFGRTNSQLYLRNAYFCQNAASQDRGHALMAEGGANADVQNVLFVQNGTLGLGIFTAEVRDNGLLAHNTLLGDLDQGISTQSAIIEDNILTASTGIGLESSNVSPTVRDNVLWGPTVSGSVQSAQQILADPGMVNAAGNDCEALFHAYATTAIVDTSTSGRLDINGTVADAGHFGGPDFDPVFWEADADADGYPLSTDCDDTDPGINPGATEIPCNTIDEDCGGVPDALDEDGDGESVCAGDCDDTDPDVNTSQSEITCNGIDDDCNGWTGDNPDQDGDGSGVCVDCDDADDENYPGNTEVCDGDDNDCDGTADNGLATMEWHDDDDGDGFGAGDPTSSCQQPSGMVADDTDCDDTDRFTYPGAIETCDGVDNNCNSIVDDGVTTQDWYNDNDGDGYGGTFNVADCAQPAGTVSNNTDCNDGNSFINPGAPEVCNGADENCDGQADEGVPTVDWYVDADDDGFGSTLQSTGCQQPPGTVADDTDCDDTSDVVYPGAAEECDGVDNDCDTEIDDADADVLAPTFYADTDGDNYGDDNDSGTVACTQPPATALQQGDCDDTEVTIFPLAVEACPDGIDNDCDGLIDTADPDYTDQPVIFWFDQDGDGAGTPGATFQGCSGDQPLGYVSPNIGEDCNDGDISISPLLGELCDGIDNDCTGAADDGLSFADFFPDVDGDGYGDPTGIPVNACDQVPGYAVDATDCDDNRGIIYPGNPEVCDNLDNDCNGTIDDGLSVVTYYPDGDSDGFGNEVQAVVTCQTIPGWLTLGGDCDDTNAAVNPNATEDPDDGIDNDCDGVGFVPQETGDTGIEELLDSDGDGVPDIIDPDPFSAGDGSGNAPTPDAGCACDTGAPSAGWLALGGILALRRRR